LSHLLILRFSTHMSKNENKPTTRKQMTLIVLIVIVFLLLSVRLLTTTNQQTQVIDRETCLTSGYIWSESAEQCYGNE